MKNRELYLRIILELKQFKVKIGMVIFFLAIITITSFFVPLIVEHIMDDGLIAKDFSVILFLTLLLLFVTSLEQVIDVIQSKLFIQMQNTMKEGLLKKVFEKLTHLEQTYFNYKNSSEIINSLMTDINKICIITDKSVLFLFSNILKIISGLLGLFIINWKMALMVIGIIPIKYLCIKYFSEKKRESVTRYIWFSKKFASWFEDNIEGIREIKLWNLYQEKYTTYGEKVHELKIQNEEQEMIDTYNNATDSILQNIMTCLIYMVGGWILCNSGLSIGGITAFFTYSIYIIMPISEILNLGLIFAGLTPSAERYYNFIDLKEENGLEKNSIDKNFIKLVFRDVAFSYGENNVLKNINLEISKGEKIAVIGKNGSGKTTIINLLLRLIEPSEGNIFLNNIDYKNFNINKYRDLFCVVSQNPYLFQDTLYNNIVLDKKVDKEIFFNICKKCKIEEIMNKSEAGCNLQLGKNGSTVSGGEKQKIAIARAIIKKSEIIILDEATSNIDKESSVTLCDMILKEFKDKTVIIVSHKIEELKGINRWYKLDE